MRQHSRTFVNRRNDNRESNVDKTLYRVRYVIPSNDGKCCLQDLQRRRIHHYKKQAHQLDATDGEIPKLFWIWSLLTNRNELKKL